MNIPCKRRQISEEIDISERKVRNILRCNVTTLTHRPLAEQASWGNSWNCGFPQLICGSFEHLKLSDPFVILGQELCINISKKVKLREYKRDGIINLFIADFFKPKTTLLLYPLLKINGCARYTVKLSQHDNFETKRVKIYKIRWTAENSFTGEVNVGIIYN